MPDRSRGQDAVLATVRGVRSFVLLVLGTLRDLLPIIGVIAFFQVFVIQEPFPNWREILTGLLMVMLGLALFIQGLQMGLFPLGESMADAFARKGNLWLLLIFAFGLNLLADGLQDYLDPENRS